MGQKLFSKAEIKTRLAKAYAYFSGDKAVVYHAERRAFTEGFKMAMQIANDKFGHLFADGVIQQGEEE